MTDDYDYETVQDTLHPEIREQESIKDVLETAADLWSDRRYFTYAPTGETATFAEMNRRANRVANALAEIGVGFGNRVGLYLTNRPEYVAGIFGCAKLGAIETPISWEYRAREVEHTLDSAGVSTILAQSDELILENITEVAADHNAIERVIAIDADAYNRIADLEGVDTYFLDDLAEQVPETNPDVAVGADDPMAILSTSGTTGLPKPAVLSNQSFLLGAKSFLGAPLPDDDVNYNGFPLFHGNNQFYSMLGPLIAGREYVLSDRFSASKFMDEIATYGVTSINVLGGLPKILDSAYDAEDIPENDLEIAIGPISMELWEHFEEKFNLTVVQLYSQTESPTLILNHPDEDEIKVGAIGKPMFPDLGHEVTLIDDGGNKVGPGRKGELIRTDPGAMLEYWNMPAKTKETLRERVIYSGDIARSDDEGYYYYVDRKKFMIRRSGENISAQEIENVIDEHPDVEESAIIPVPDDLRGEEVKVLVNRTSPDLTPADIVSQVAGQLASHKVPRYVEFVDTFPRTPSERIKRVQLANEEAEHDDHGWDREAELSEWEASI
ncbi:class I adenylate-forming enzyme family protein [Halalkalicoccus sp. NIPERK01]|uniref:class I adenylate-forming enzyme family protein n=1 Tax=Halalkalicoccus sp. NIPERK01 TaxID=3053469 RepID=UPI00256F2CA6|nr:class I adenylate-forming enzyme family protein [Halalkalicoccus sp. NIPERK01]MDL5363813.1 class I adenylate-forming enzyme family protein [Halalkalicoccus sp. NIPERK01]